MVFQMENNKNNPQVFISFRGKDERHKLVPYLKYHLNNNSVNVVTDNDATGEPVGNLFKYIRNSRIVIVIFSVSYLESKCCLDELVEIMKCLETEKLKVAIPIFYKVKPSHVKTQTGDFGKKFVALQNKHPDSVNKWREALEVVARYIGLTYENNSSLSELDFVMKIVESVEKILNSNPETTKMLQGETSNSSVFDGKVLKDLYKLLHLSKTLEALDLERSCHRQGFMFSPACKDLISSMQSSNNSFKISPNENTIQSLETLGDESVENATNWLALQMMTEQKQPALIFTNWDKIDLDAKNSIIYSARKKKQMMSQILKGCNRDVDLKPSYGNCPSFVEVQTWDWILEHKAPRDWHRRDLRRSISYRDNRDRCYPLAYEMSPDPNSIGTQRTIDNIILGEYHFDKRVDDMSCISFLRYLLIKICFSVT